MTAAGRATSERSRTDRVNLRRWLNFGLLVLVTVVAGFVSYRQGDRLGLAGASAGAALGFLLCGVSHLFMKQAQIAEGHAIIKAMMGSIIASFGTLIGAVLAVRWLWPEALGYFALTAVSIYLVHRFSVAVAAGLDPGRARTAAAAPPSHAPANHVEEMRDR